MTIDKKVVLSIGAHPDDAEFLCAGTLALLQQKGWDIHIATITAGDCGTTKYDREEISKIRKGEAAEAARIFKGAYHCLGFDDAFVMYDRKTLLAVIKLLRKVRPSIVLTTSFVDYCSDHEMTGKLTRSACFMAGIPNIKIDGTEPAELIPNLYYLDSDEGVDILGHEILPSTVIDITDTIAIKEHMLKCHKSQYEWLRAYHGMDEYITSMKSFSRKRGKRIGVKYAEGFRQHLAPPFPKDNILKNELTDLVYLVK